MRTAAHILFVLVLAPLAGLSQSTLTLEVEVPKGSGGNMLMVALCPSEEAYSTEKGCRTTQVRIGFDDKGVQEVRFDRVAAGDHAVRAFLDRNGNEVLDLNALGIPSEPFGFSQDAMGRFAAPGFKEASFSVGGDETRVAFRMRGG
ncbi:MAG: DUF2141 domain-containing protein [Flavobacteriales bacterium]|nr:DUF2141 domain-containing protein [Flavobacteriales bacterium]